MPVLLGSVTSLINSVDFCIYFGSLVSVRERAGGWKNENMEQESTASGRQKMRTSVGEEIGAEAILPGKLSPSQIFSFHHLFSEAVVSTGVENKGSRRLSSVLFSALTGDNFSASSFLEV